MDGIIVWQRSNGSSGIIIAIRHLPVHPRAAYLIFATQLVLSILLASNEFPDKARRCWNMHRSERGCMQELGLMIFHNYVPPHQEPLGDFIADKDKLRSTNSVPLRWVLQLRVYYLVRATYLLPLQFFHLCIVTFFFAWSSLKKWRLQDGLYVSVKMKWLPQMMCLRLICCPTILDPVTIPWSSIGQRSPIQLSWLSMTHKRIRLYISCLENSIWYIEGIKKNYIKRCGF